MSVQLEEVSSRVNVKVRGDKAIRSLRRRIKVSTMSVKMTKGQSVSMVKSNGGTLTRVRMGLGWDAVKKRGLFGKKAQEIDLDASCMIYDRQGTLIDAVWWKQLTSKDGSIVHTGGQIAPATVTATTSQSSLTFRRFPPTSVPLCLSSTPLWGRISRRSRTPLAALWITQRRPR